jgi:signal transduction histidine kinase
MTKQENFSKKKITFNRQKVITQFFLLIAPPVITLGHFVFKNFPNGESDFIEARICGSALLLLLLGILRFIKSNLIFLRCLTILGGWIAITTIFVVLICSRLNVYFLMGNILAILGVALVFYYIADFMILILLSMLVWLIIPQSFGLQLENFGAFTYFNLVAFCVGLAILIPRSILFRNEIILLERLNDEKEKVEKLNEDKDNFISIISHDLRGPLGSLASLFDEIIKKPEDLNLKLLHLLRDSTRRTFSLLEELLTWARSQKGQLNLVHENCELYPIITECVSIIKPQAEAKQISIETIGFEKPIYIHADAVSIKVVVRNILSNAIKFTHKNGYVQIRAEVLDKHVQLVMTDNGTGMGKADLDNLFIPGRRRKSSLGTHKEKGSGLGLILSKEFLDANHGSIRVESIKGEGSQFTIFLPAGTA